MTTNTRRNIVELRELGEDVQDIEQLKTYLNETISELNFILRGLTLSNLDGEIVTVTIPANSTLKIPHKLRIIPKYKIILKQVGGGLILDGEYSATHLEVTNTGGTDATLTIIIVKN